MRNKKFPYITLIAGILIGASSCQYDDLSGERLPDGKTDIVFGASLEEERSVGTRSSTRGTPGIDSVYMAFDPWDQDFYIELNTEKEGQPFTAYGVYNVPSGYVGQLKAVDPEKALNWENLDKKHTFYSWTVPWMKTNPAVFANDSEASGAADGETSEPEEQLYTPSNATLPVKFYNSSEQNGFNKNRNNAIYEGFIGAKSVPYSYVEHGKYVDLTFHHLVSKINLESLILINSDGSVEKDLQADMTFLNMPVEATFYPHPVAGDQSGAPAGWRPYVGAPYEESPDNGVTYFIENKGQEDIFYICPEVDFRNVEYQIKINNEGYEEMKTYYGTFDDVEFVRNTGWGYDKPGDDPENPADSKILHAGEVMRLNVVLIPGIGPGLKVIIEKWSTDKPVDSQYHTHQGFYSDAELQELMDLMYSLNAETYEDLPEEMQFLFEMYGYEENGKKYFPLYENVTPKKGNSTSNIFPIPPGYIIDGMGHTVTLKTNSGAYWGSEGTSNYFNIGGLCRDIYFSDENGNNTIYIDKEGYIWITDENGRFIQTDNKLPDEMPDGIRGFDISCRTGKIRETTYFNDRLGS